MNTTTYDHPEVKIKPPVIFLAYIGAGVLLSNIVPIDFINADSMWLQLIAYVLILDGVCLAFFSMRRFRKLNTNISTRKAVNSLVTSGVYRYSRNPIYLGMFLSYGGIILLTANFWLMMLAIPLYFQMKYAVIVKEETYLLASFGSEYERYKDSVNRWISYPRR